MIQNTNDYIIEAHRQLTDEKTYKKLDTTEYQTEIETVLDLMVKNDDITDKVKKRLCGEKPRTPEIYFLPKIHKKQTPPPGRPIVSANNCPTENISAFVDHFLNPMVKEQRSYIKDTTDFINKVENCDPKGDYIIGSLDVTSLYTNIPNSEGIKSIEKILNSSRNRTEKPSNESLTKLLELVLTRNNFQFNGENYLQIGGTAMGTKVAPTYANLFMSRLETKILTDYAPKPSIWYRYIDDIFFIWEHGEKSLERWLEYINSYHNTIKFTAEWSKTEINFLDTTVKKDPKTNKLYTDLYKKNYRHKQLSEV